MKYVVVILDGAAGWPLESLEGQTTLAAARTPNLDALARAGMVGLAQTVPEGAEPSSSAACTSILGYDPVKDYVGRAAIEAASMGITLAPDEIALRMNLVGIDGGVMASYNGGGISTEEAREVVLDLADALGSDEVALHPGVAYRHIMVVTGHPELLDLSYTPPHDISDKPVASHLPTGAGAGFLLELMERARPVLENNGVVRCRAEEGAIQVTDIWPFWPGAAPGALTPFSERRGITGAMTSGVDLLNGLAVLFGLDRLEIAGVSGGSDNDYAAQTEGALAALEDHDLVVIHIEAPDEEGHAGDADGKLAAIEAIDRDVLPRVLAFAEKTPTRILAMPDHPTPVAIKTHVGEPVPFILWGPGVEANGAERYSEEAAAATGLTVDPGFGVMGLLTAE